MANLFAWLMSAVWPLAQKVLTMLGIGAISYAAITPLVNSVIAQAQNSFGQIGGTVAQMLSLAGAPEVFGIISGALIARVSFIALGKIGKVTA